MNIKGFIFDLDGTLLDSMPIWDNLGAEYLLKKGIQNTPKDIKNVLKPLSLLQASEYFINMFNIKLSTQLIMDEINNLIEDKYKYQIALKEGVIEFLEKNKNIKMCIATATYRHLVEYALKRLDIDKYFDFIITSSEVGNSKQSPDIFIRAAGKLGVPINEIVVFEDALHAIVSAKSAGFYTVGVHETAFEKDKEEIIKIADCYINNFNEFEVLKK